MYFGLGSLVRVAGEELKLVALYVADRALRGLAVLYLKNLAAYLALVKSHRLTPFVAGRGVLRQRADALPEPPHFPEAPGAHAEQETLKTGLRETLRRGRIRPGTSLKIIIWAAAAAASR